jgi:Ni,Fe-hydrogenase maturation factor
MLLELKDRCGIEVRVLACQTGPLPEEVRPGLSDPVARAVPEAAARIAAEYFG